MYLKRLEMQGFKSFADRLKLNLSTGVTAIVGPNGCGKSNLNEAIKWTLGEQSARTLRCGSMEEIIFAGSKSRPSVSLAEVTLTFDNTSGIIPLNYPEITVTRRLFRSGESEYLINRVPSRLKDIRDLFLDTGIGTDAYAFMEQGKVEFILRAKPEERRALFEEAAGVAKFKVRKDEALRKLEKVEFDMVRLNDTIAMYQEQVRNLDSAVRKTKLYQKYQSELHTWEIVSLAHQFTEKNKGIQETESLIATVRDNEQKWITEVDSVEAKLTVLRTDHTVKEQELVQTQETLANYDTDLVRSEERIKSLRDTLSWIEEERPGLGQEKETRHNELLKYTERSIQIEQEVANLSQQIEQIQGQIKVQEELQVQLNAQVRNEEHQYTLNQQELFACLQQKNNLHNEMVHYTGQLKATESDLKNVTSDLSLAEKKQKESTQTLTNLNEEFSLFKDKINELEDKKKQHQDLISSLKNQAQELNLRIENLREENIRLGTRQEILQNYETELTRKQHLATTLLNAKLPGITGPVANILSVTPGYEKMVETVLGDQLYWLISDTEFNAHAAVEYVRQNNLGWVTVIVLEKTSRLSYPAPNDVSDKPDNSIVPILSYVTVQEGYATVLDFLVHPFKTDGAQVYSTGTIAGGSYPVDLGPLSLRAEMNGLLNRLDAILLDLTQLQNEKDTLISELKRQEEAGVQIVQNLHTLQVKKDSCQNNIDQVSAFLRLGKEEIDTLHQELNRITEEQTRNNTKYNELSFTLNNLDTQETGLRATFSQQEEKINTLRTKVTELQPILTGLKVTVSSLEERKQALLREREQMNNLITRTQHLLGSIDEKITNLDSLEQETNSLLVNEETNLAQKKQTRNEWENKVVMLRKVDELLREEIAKLEPNLTHARTELHKVQQTLHELQIKHNRMESEKNFLRDRLTQDYQCNEDDLNQYLSLIPSNDKPSSEIEEETGKEITLNSMPVEVVIQTRIERLRKRIENMGNVNLAAPEEYDQLQSRINFLLTQQQDLAKAKEDLVQIINRIKGTIQERFKSSFDAIRKNFQNTFRMLFEGGEADLVLTNEDNILESGVEIYAQPPGKKLQNISLLSGGESALTALSLLFGFFLVKPAPFCILDEVDAALDKANIHRFVNLVKEFAKRTQFLIVTHNESTMELADIFYGVTMEEFGVSRIYSVKYRSSGAIQEDLPALREEESVTAV